MINRLRLSIVIPTLGGGTLKPTVDSLEPLAAEVQLEVLVCVPQAEVERIGWPLPAWARLVPCSGPGQVFQRSAGFTQAKGDFVLQLDDDISIATADLMLMLRQLERYAGPCALGPIFCDAGSRAPMYSFQSRPWFEDTLDFVFNSLPFGCRKLGTHSCVGAAYPVDRDMSEDKLVPVSWLAGGCTLTRREHLIHGNFYPFPGKAVYEDLLHSQLRRQAGIVQLVSTRASAFTKRDLPPAPGKRPSLRRRVSDLVVRSRRRAQVSRLLGAGRVAIAWAIIGIPVAMVLHKTLRTRSLIVR